jgi:hypothetical protein
MVYGDGGAGKTTLVFDLAFHLAAGEDWLGIPVPRAARVLLIENEGPRPLLRKKLRRKTETWKGASLGGRVSVFESPWGGYTFDDAAVRDQLISLVNEHKIDVIVAGPLTRVGMEAAGTLAEVTAFMRLVDGVRSQCERPLTVILVHHENKAGSVSGAWEGAVDTLVHVEARGNGRTGVLVQKARWSSTYHQKAMILAWMEGESFRLEGERALRDEIVQLLQERKWLTAKEIAAPEGIGASETTVKEVLQGDHQLFESKTGDDAKEVGRHSNAIVWGLRQPEDADDADGQASDLSGDVEKSSASAFPLRNADDDEDAPRDSAASDCGGGRIQTHTRTTTGDLP